MEELRSLPKNKSKRFIVSFYCVSNLWFLLVQIQSPQFSILDEKEFPLVTNAYPLSRGNPI